jgi:hypothetical protein
LELQYKTARAQTNVRDFPNEGYGELPLLCDKYGCNKGSMSALADKKLHPYYPLPPHTYTEIYELLFRPVKFTARNIFECGIGSKNPQIEYNMGENGIPGASLRVWRDFFPNALVWGADIDKEALFEEDRIKTGYMDQTNPGEVGQFFDSAQTRFDVMIDDGLHSWKAAKCLFDNAIGYLAGNGVYIIEDASIETMKLFCDSMISNKNYIIKYLNMETPRDFGNNLIIVRKK